MVSVQVLSDSDKDEIESTLEEFCSVEEDGDLMPYLFEDDTLADGDVEVRFFLMSEDGGEVGTPASVYFEVTVDSSASWHEEIGSYSADNLRNGGDVYDALADELEGVVESVTGNSPSFVMKKGSGAFTEEVDI